MAITAASIEANGWVLRLTFTGSLGNFASYTIDPDGTPRVNLTSQHAGFVPSAGTAISGTFNRALVGTKPLRKPVNWNGTSADPAVVDETDLGGGSIQVRIALSEHVYATDSSLSLAVLAGWRTGESAASGISVTNNSTTVAPIPIMRWARPSFDVVTGAFRVSLFVASHHPVLFSPVCGVKFTVTDGTNVKTTWAMALGTDNDYGDNLRCYTATLDPTTATALTQGLLRCDAEVYPWLGSMRTTDTAGTKSMTSLTSAANDLAAAAPHAVCYDPAGTRYSNRFVFVDSVNGTTTASAAMVATTLAGAKAVAAASRPQNVNTAIQALYSQNITLSAANGGSSYTRSCDGGQVVLAAGTHINTGSGVSTGANGSECPVRIYGDPADSDPKTNCIYQTSATAPANLRILRAKFRNLQLQIGANYLFANASASVWVDNCKVIGRSGQETSATALTQGNVLGWTKSTLARTAANMAATLLIRGSQGARQAYAAAVLTYRFIPYSEDSTQPIGASTAPSPAIANATGLNATAAYAEDQIVAFCDLRSIRRRSFAAATATAAAAGTPNPSMRRHCWFNNIVEKIGDGSVTEPFFSCGEDESLSMSYNIVEGNTFVGERCNSFYSDPLPATIADTNTQKNDAYCNRIANNFCYWMPTKHDAFLDPTTQTVRGTANGYRPQMVDAWSYTYGVAHENNHEAGLGNSFAAEYYGPKSTRATGSSGVFVADASINPGTNAGGGNYTPAIASPLLGRLQRGNSDRDLLNATRSANGTIGAYQGAGINLVPTGARSVSLVAMAGITLSLALAPAGSRHAQVARVANLAWAGSLLPARAVSAHRAQVSALGLVIAVAPAATRLSFGSGATTLGYVAAGALLPASSCLDFGDLPVTLLLPAALPGALCTLRIGADQKTLVVRFN